MNTLKYYWKPIAGIALAIACAAATCYYWLQPGEGVTVAWYAFLTLLSLLAAWCDYDRALDREAQDRADAMRRHPAGSAL